MILKECYLKKGFINTGFLCENHLDFNLEAYAFWNFNSPVIYTYYDQITVKIKE